MVDEISNAYTGLQKSHDCIGNICWFLYSNLHLQIAVMINNAQFGANILDDFAAARRGVNSHLRIMEV